MRVYLDVWCLNRPFDDQQQDRIRLEAEAIIRILRHLQLKDWEWISSEALDLEIAQTPDKERQNRVRLLTAQVDEIIRVDAQEIARAHELETLGFHAIDALHLACDESGSTDVFLTTDDRLLHLARRVSGHIRVQVVNPLRWLAEVTQ